MTALDSVAVASGTDIALTLEQFLHRLKSQRQLQPLLVNAIVQELLVQRARQAGLSVSDVELQKAADDFRHRQGLNSAEQFRAWLAQERVSLDNFEAELERPLLIGKLKEHVTRDRTPEHFAANRPDYDRARLHGIVVDREDLARELRSQLQEEGRAFAELAAAHSRHPSRGDGGRLGWVLRKQVAPQLRDPVFAAREGQIVGPLAAADGFHLLHVEALRAAELDPPTQVIIRDELFNAWLADQLRNGPLSFPLLDAV